MKIILKIRKYDNCEMTIIFKKLSNLNFIIRHKKKPMAWVTKDDVRITWGGGCPKDEVIFFCKEFVYGKFCEERKIEKKDP